MVSAPNDSSLLLDQDTNEKKENLFQLGRKKI